MRRLALALVVPLCSFVHGERYLLYTGAVRYQLDSIATVSALTHREEGACVSRWTTVYGPDSRTFYLLAIGAPSEVVGRDTASIARLVCPDSEPPIHTHLKLGDRWSPYAPSDVDELSLAASKAPFGIVLVAGTSTAIIYGVKP